MSLLSLSGNCCICVQCRDATGLDFSGGPIEIRFGFEADRVEVQIAIHFHHHGLHPRVSPISTGGHERPCKGVIERHAPAVAAECLNKRLLQRLRGMKSIGADAYIRSLMASISIFVGQRSTRKAMPVDHDASTMLCHGDSRSRLELCVMRVIPKA